MEKANGFSYISVLLSLVIIGSTLPILVYFIAKVDQKDNQTYISIHQFFTMVQHDCNAAIDVSSDQQHIYFHLQDKETAVLEQYKDMIRRRVGLKGHEIYIRDVESFHVQPMEYGIIVTLKMLNGEQYEKVFSIK